MIREEITSERNALLKEVRRVASRGELSPEGWCVAESVHLLEEALRSGRPVRAVLVAEGAMARVEGMPLEGVRVAAVPDALFRTVATTEHSQGVVALVEPPQWEMADLFTGTPLLAVLDSVQDPGNAGNIVRTAEAFGATGVIFPKGAVSPFNPKTLRASAGSLFRLPFVAGVEAEAVRRHLARHGIALYAAMPAGGRRLDEVDWRAPAALVVGSEGRGVGEGFGAVAGAVRIPTRGVESLNAAMAAGVILYEAARQRQFGQQ